jgi:DNA-binding NtrC family response regulator
MFEDALFGHAKGAFTGANREVPGLLAEANGGTLFLDEISGLSLACQVKMLRAIELGAFRPVGATRDRVSDFRVVAASNEDLVALVERQRFRGDLLHRLGGMVLEVPPLSEHSDDIPELVEHFLRAMCSHAGITSAALSRLLKHSWPGNIRELRHTVERAFVLADGGEVTFEAVAAALERSSVPGLKRCVDDFAKNCMLNLLEECRWNTDKVATSLGVHRATVYRRMERLGIEPRERDSALIVRRDDRLMELA